MTELAEFALGLGVFFVGMQMVGEHLHQLSGPTFRSLVARFTASAWTGGAVGLLFGLLMQSATGVTFVLVNMVTSGLIAAEAALSVIIWTNVGLTALAFVVTLDIHPIVAWSVGITGVAASLMRRRLWKQVANVLVGVGLLLFGLETMGSTAGPLQHSQWLQTFVAHTLTSMPTAFAGGFLLAAILQSNTGAALLVITLATGGVFELRTAAMLIYGTNLGAIVLRLLLSAGMHGTPMQLVRFEDFFCLVSGALMVTLFYVERLTSAPLVLASVEAASPDIDAQLALVFLLSNLLPALVISPFRRACLRLLERLWPAPAGADAAEPKYLTPRSLEDPATAVDLIPRELARALASVQASAQALRQGHESAANAEQREADCRALMARIDDFAGQLALVPLEQSASERLNVAREIASVVSYVAESYSQLRRSLEAIERFAGTAQVREQVLSALDALLGAAVTAVDTRGADAIARLRQQSRSHSAPVEKTRESCVRGAAADELGDLAVAQRTAVLKVLADFELITWVMHRLSKLLDQISTSPQSQTVSKG
jgi:phosphate:Na+ symporter